MAVPYTFYVGERWHSHGSPRHWFWGGGEVWVLIAVPYTFMLGRGGVLMAVLDTGFGVGVERRGSDGSHRRWLWGRGGGSHGSPRCWLWGVEAGVLMAVSDAGCGWERRGFS